MLANELSVDGKILQRRNYPARVVCFKAQMYRMQNFMRNMDNGSFQCMQNVGNMGNGATFQFFGRGNQLAVH
jgi:hypothetical protein